MMSLDFIMEMAWKSALISGAALLAVMLLRSRSAADRGAVLRIAIGLHAGPAIVGRMGHGKVSSLTAIGDTMNTASRLEGLAKERNVQLAMSADLVRIANIAILDHASEDIEIRGREAKLETWIVPQVADVAAALEAPAEIRASA